MVNGRTSMQTQPAGKPAENVRSDGSSADRPEALDPAAAFALGQWGMVNRLAHPGRPPRRSQSGP